MARERNAERTKEGILNAARSVFAAKGFDGARVDEIAKWAKINKRMIYHYFGNKEQLYIEVLRDNFRQLLAVGREANLQDLSPLDKAQEFIRRYFYFLANEREFVKLLLWESLQGKQFSIQLLPEVTQTTLPMLESIIEEGVKDGVFRQDLDLKHLIISINAMCIVYFSRQHVYSTVWHGDMNDPEMLEERLQHILELTLNGILVK
ncbi:TetR/AcrR family transcriptional regulator [Desulfofalx alkaliphila]|uniref:TetR/AcrR family transcriptional regulator n=1 Tax=Desulfofalx alkaliphila TaxID=105483 RepID=UPI0004E26BCA|nr:TetR/AcrR family transcriptional regulator [Desulfofalx alkaliphila]